MVFTSELSSLLVLIPLVDPADTRPPKPNQVVFLSPVIV